MTGLGPDGTPPRPDTEPPQPTESGASGPEPLLAAEWAASGPEPPVATDWAAPGPEPPVATEWAAPGPEPPVAAEWAAPGPEPPVATDWAAPDPEPPVAAEWAAPGPEPPVAAEWAAPGPEPPVATEWAAPDPEPPVATESGASDGPPGGSIFTLEGRRAPGLYLVAWVMIVGGLALALVVGPMASSAGVRQLLVVVGALVVTLGFAAAAGSQVLERSVRGRERYRGPAPLLVFGAYVFAMAALGVVLIDVLGIDPDRPFNFLAVGVVQAAGYALLVWLFSIRTGALTWRSMGWPTRQGSGLARTLRGIGVAALVMLPTTFGLVLLGGIIGLLLGVDAPRVLPLSETALDGLFVTIAAALVVPIGEELFFRGFALTSWLRDLGERSALIRTSVFFALVHIVNIGGVSFGEGLSQAVLQTSVILPVGFVLGWLFLRHGMAGAIGGHVTYNSLLLSLAFLASRIPDPV